MIVYDKVELENLTLVEEAHSLKEASFIDSEQYKVISKQLTIPKGSNNLLIRLAFFILGSFLYSSICGFLTLISENAIGENFEVILFLYAAVGFAGAEALTRLKFFGQGLDDAFIIGSQLNLAIAIGLLTNGNEIVIASIITLTALINYLRYLHLSMALLFCLALTATLTYAMFEIGTTGKTILPFVIMLFAAAIYFLSKTIISKLVPNFYYKGVLLANSFSLILFYLSGNYLVVRELSVLLLDAAIVPGHDISFAFFFYGFTFAVPLFYLIYSILKKDRIMLWIGFLALGFSIYTIRFYYAILPIEIALNLGGVFLFGFTYFVIKKLKDKEAGVTFKPDRLTKTNAFLNAEILISSQLGLKPEITTESNIGFGGGEFSGGGSGGEF
ncbi:hypothetical protein [Flavobacterium frigoris]|uniref:DUF4401 domain-containing protein n=1 Tax=Flavobacterium frigoris TaxID=229204 RepID=A0A1H9MEC7_FLAFI|nr:hypothetical protein [Flavobacterium frigoris]SER21819.1 hypothetical protein SAMN05444355_10858 [Flavobacterium frigoris]